MHKARSKTLLATSGAWRAFYETPDGRLALAEMAIWCNAYTPIESNDPIEMARLVGERNVFLRIAALIGAKPTDFLQQAQDDTDILDRMINARSN